MAIFTVVITALCLLMGGRCIYNLFFHPLRHYPGSLFCRASSVPRLWHRLAGTAVQHAHRAHEKYGTCWIWW
ncbi:hypothetical protein B0J12DRAFT_681410 [Macrophomina phaseolina]|uniref:Secreted protein n=1 Tax=Macrophomina phaseolina TaxID=35725 RepID=A0ABQ8FXB4_9PEZI|nr:hypothetical protein B0J12DRAFT_681410 [Macrophomina phaseolina]